MRHLTLLLALAMALAAVPLPAQPPPATYEVDPRHSAVTFKIRHFVTKVNGRFTDFAGTIAYDPEEPPRSSVTFTVQAASISTDNERRDADLRSANFFEVERYPTLTFVSTAVVATDADSLEVTGDLTIHGVTTSVTVPVEVLGFVPTGEGGGKAGFEAVFTIDRKDFGITWNRVLDQGAVLLGDEVEIAVQVEADKG